MSRIPSSGSPGLPPGAAGVLATVVALTVAACGGNDGGAGETDRAPRNGPTRDARDPQGPAGAGKSSDGRDPEFRRGRANVATADAPDMRTAERWCERAQAGEFDAQIAGRESTQVRFLLEGPGPDVTCLLP